MSGTRNEVASRRRPARLALVAAGLVVLYVASFFGFRHFAYPCSLAHCDIQGWDHIVIYSWSKPVHLALRAVYAPLAALAPGGCLYPDAEEFDKLTAAYDAPTVVE